ncbi:MAG: thymidine phosphorylase [Planctomycetes bacterium]|nr:thymidine phosphorylase [Planctomycetota bacterium]
MSFSSIPELIKKKRDGGIFTPSEVEHLVIGIARGYVEPYQASALCMAVFFRGLDDDELVAWTMAMRDSGRTLDWSGSRGIRVDKHSTGGVGDKISIPLAPIVASCGVAVPMLSGRGLGHTGGTLDKLEAIPGFRTQLTIEELIRNVNEIGVAMGGQTADLAPADKMLYSLRDVTATVESIPLIVSSILAKKLAEKLDGLVMDVKFGSGAFMQSTADARSLAKRIVATAKLAGCPTVALLTNMDAPLGAACGNANEIAESVEILQGGGPSDVRDLTIELAAEMLMLAKAAVDLPAGRARARSAIADGAALRKFGELIQKQGGDPGVIDDPSRLPQAPRTAVWKTPEAGYLQKMDAGKVGLAVVALGGGRAKVKDTIDPAVGVRLLQKLGARVDRGQPVFEIAYREENRREIADRYLNESVVVGSAPTPPAPLILERIH